jgi:histidine kinase/DNA gyrase B/HSP90-like ATPase
MSDQAVLRAVPTPRTKERLSQSDWSPSSVPVVVGKDILELLSTSMYVDPMTIYREYTQNAADAIDEAREQGSLSAAARGQVDIAIDTNARTIRIRDNGTGIASPKFVERLSNLGSSVKRGTAARGFRGVGRLAGLGYCQELTFRSRVEDEPLVSELRWDCRTLKTALRSARHGQPLAALIREMVSVRRASAESQPKRFFEVELRGVIRHRNDRLLSPVAVGEYLAQVAPVPFSPEFAFGPEITAALRSHLRLGELDIRVNGAGQPIYRPHRNRIEFAERPFDKVMELEFRELASLDGGVAAIAWILHHGYVGAIPTKALVKGIRFRTGNMQVGDNGLLEELFPEPRFNGWAIGEVHVLDAKVIPNGRRDHFEQSVHFDNLLNQLTPSARDIARRCRQSSIGRKWLREFEIHKHAALEHAKACARGGLARVARQAHSQLVTRSIKAMRKVVSTRHISDDVRSEMTSQAATVEARVTRLLGAEAKERDPLTAFKPQVRSAYQHVISLIYDCASNSAAAAALVDRILARLADQPSSSKSLDRTRSRPSKRSQSKNSRRRATQRR